MSLLVFKPSLYHYLPLYCCFTAMLPVEILFCAKVFQNLLDYYTVEPTLQPPCLYNGLINATASPHKCNHILFPQM